MDYYEQAVMQFLTANGEIFLAPQYSIQRNRHEWSCPDFVALQPRRRTCYVVEVSANADLGSVGEKIRNREKQWLTPLKEQFAELGLAPLIEHWEILIFVREGLTAKVSRWSDDQPDVTVIDIDRTLTPWKWNWARMREPDYSFREEAFQSSTEAEFGVPAHDLEPATEQSS